MITITIDGKKATVKPGTTLLDAAQSVGVSIPTLCHHRMVEGYGACRICVTEIKIKGCSSLVTACNYPITEELEAFTNSELTMTNRRGVLSLLLARFPNVPIIKQLAKFYQVEGPTYSHPNRSESENACILCGLCVRACKEVAREDIIGFAGRGPSRRVTMPFEDHYNRCIGCGTCAYVCPTGAIKLEQDPNNPVDSDRIRKYGMRVNEEIARFDTAQNRMRKVGTTTLVEIMNDYDLLPTHNYKFGSHPLAHQIASYVWRDNYFQQQVPDGCWLGCMLSCAHGINKFELASGPYKGQKVLVDGPEYETVGGCGSNLGIFDPHVVAEINFYCDTYGIDTISFGTGLAFVMECYEAGILDLEKTGGLDLHFGNGAAALEILHQMAEGKGFGPIVGKGIRYMKAYFVEHFGADPNFVQDIGMEVKGLEFSEYMTKESLAQQGGYAMANKGPQHDEAWLIFMDQVNNQIPTFEDKAEALAWFPYFRTWFGLNGLCKLPWNDILPPDNAQYDEAHKIPKHVEGYCNYFAGMTGIEITPKDLITQSERVYNFQRVLNLRLGYGRRNTDYPPYRAMGPVTAEEYESRVERYDRQLKELVGFNPEGKSTQEKMKALRAYREDQYEKLLDAVYKRRGWTKDGVPTLETLKRLGIDYPEVVAVVKPYLEQDK